MLYQLLISNGHRYHEIHDYPFRIAKMFAEAIAKQKKQEADFYIPILAITAQGDHKAIQRLQAELKKNG